MMMPNSAIIIGAPRSGTNMLRDVLTSFDSVGTWPCDEINYIWRHGNVRYPSDEIPPDRANDSVRRYIRSRFDSLRNQHDLDVVVEKTCANSLRVPFVDQIIPEAKYIYIYRDGIDATGSARLRWTAPLDIAYLLEKVRFVPITDLPYYGIRYFWSRLYRLFSREKRLAFWGPKLAGMEDLLRRYSLEEVCALQWERCVTAAERAFSEMSDDKVIRVRYEDFVHHPAAELQRITEFLGLSIPQEAIQSAVASVSPKSLGKGRQALGKEKVESLEALVGQTLERYGYLGN